GWASTKQADPSPESKTALITCRISISNFDKVFIHWYRKRPGAAPKRIAYMATRLFLEKESDEGKFSIEKDLAKSQCTLTVGRLTAQDAATYYCARWDAQQQRAIGNLHKDTLSQPQIIWNSQVPSRFLLCGQKNSNGPICISSVLVDFGHRVLVSCTLHTSLISPPTQCSLHPRLLSFSSESQQQLSRSTKHADAGSTYGHNCVVL
uniref:Ig-like domain-containing protein n=1 Tax=Meleagris gallopavo TaxID=9103 RepID=A0A803Y3I2_MELGA